MFIKLLRIFILSINICYVQAFSLTEAYTKALEFNADYLAQIANTDSVSELQSQAKASLLPQINANATYNETYLNSSGAAIYYSQPTIGAQIQQVIFDFNKFSTYTKSKFASLVGDLKLVNARQQLMVNVAQAYFDVLYASDNLNAIKINKQAFLSQMEFAQKSFNAGTVTITDVNDAKANYDLATAQEIEATNNLFNKMTIFQNMTGLNPNLIQPLVDQITLTLPTPNLPTKWEEMAKSGNLDIKIAQYQVDMATQDIKIAKSGHMPSLNIVGNYQLQGTANINGTNSQSANYYASLLSNIPGVPLSSYSNSYVGLQLNIPILAGGGINSQVRQAIDNYENAQQQLTGVIRKTDQLVLDAFYQVQNGVSLVEAQTKALKSAKLKLKSQQVGYKLGIRNSVDLANAQNDYVKTLIEYNQSRYNYLIYQLKLEYLCGKIDEDFIKLVDNNIEH